MPEDLRLPAIAAEALTMRLVVALMQQRERPASTALPMWRTRGDGGRPRNGTSVSQNG